MCRRRAMVENQIKPMGICNPRVLAAMGAVPREAFVPQSYQANAYDDSPLPLESGQTISQPFIVAYMIEMMELQGGERVLEVGTGSGYAAAVLAEIAAEVYTVERLERLAQSASCRLRDLGYQNVHVITGDGSLGDPEHAPFDAILVSAGGPQVPQSLKSQLKIGGRLVIPVGTQQLHQRLLKIRRLEDNQYREESIADVRFVPLVGEDAWPGR